MRVAVIISSLLGWPLLQDLLAQGVVAGVAVPASGREEAEQLHQWLTQSGLAPRRLTRAGLAEELTSWLTALQPTAALVLTFPWRIPAAVLDLPPQGFINVHFAALPGYRGPEPTFWQLRNGEAAGAVTAHRMEADFDTGPVLAATPVPIGLHDTHGLHRAQLALAAVGTGRALLEALRTGAPGHPQDEAAARYWPRPALPDLCIDWQEPAEAIARLVRAVNPWNRGALAALRGQPLRILSATPRPETVDAAPGTVVLAAPGQALLVACGAGQVLQLDMAALEEGFFTGGQLANLGIQPGEVLGTLPATAAAIIPQPQLG
ncbi:methionyl-tRNA formyltransferase [Hymenobacter jeollabukensis]|uniref:Methionyl-tRNA formyltransferase n=1 Tax=Hymenobacter jeollabukensis TaxID=2025313 RepID=A0A5R8WSS6_9BACT|nr:formyltransferase family protein [Hymenobacter jeollabukensis]TLM93929.1 methionyl-tRNA formyltransferase [Hymenobacter jeollabukensis]